MESEMEGEGGKAEAKWEGERQKAAESRAGGGGLPASPTLPEAP